MMIKIKTIEHARQRHDTCGNWVINGEQIIIYVSEMGDWKYEMLVALHELVEVLLCKDRGISQKAVDDDIKAPYREQHRQAEFIEKQMAQFLNIDWEKYSKTVDEL
jgi:Mn-dependent DtxR family transcriptional regulator